MTKTNSSSNILIIKCSNGSPHLIVILVGSGCLLHEILICNLCKCPEAVGWGGSTLVAHSRPSRSHPLFLSPTMVCAILSVG